MASNLSGLPHIPEVTAELPGASGRPQPQPPNPRPKDTPKGRNVKTPTPSNPITRLTLAAAAADPGPNLRNPSLQNPPTSRSCREYTIFDHCITVPDAALLARNDLRGNALKARWSRSVLFSMIISCHGFKLYLLLDRPQTQLSLFMRIPWSE